MAIEHLTFSLTLILTDFNFSVNSHPRPGATILEGAILENVGVKQEAKTPAFKEQLRPLPPPFVSTDTLVRRSPGSLCGDMSLICCTCGSL